MKHSKKLYFKTNTKRIVSKNLLSLFALFTMTAILTTSCEPKEDNDCDNCNEPPTAQQFNNIRTIALENLTQTFGFNTADGYINLTSEQGVQININANCLTYNGNAITGDVSLEYIELFEKGNMLTTNKPTMGILPNGDKALLVSGGEFFLEATQNGNILDTNCGIQLVIPAGLTGGADQDMSLWNGEIDNEGNLAWDEVDDENGEGPIPFVEGNNYYPVFEGFGWANVDRFYSDPRPKTTIQAQAPEGYDNENSSIYLSYDGEAPALAQLDTYDNVLNIFSEHYGQIPIGLECHVIFVTETDGIWRYAIKPTTIVANDIITFNLGETIVGTEASLIALLNDLP